MEIPMQEEEVQNQIAPSGDGTPYINLVYTRMRDNGFTTDKTPNAQALAQRIVSDKNALDDIYDILTKDLRYKDLPDIKEFKQTLLAEAGTVKKKAPSGSGLPTGSADVQTTVTETQTPSIEVTEEQQTLQAPSTEASQIIDPLNPLAPVTKEQADIRALQTNQVGFIPEVNEQDVQKATSVLQKDFDQRNWGFGMASNEQDKARRAREKQRYVAENIDRLTRDYAIKRKRNEFIQDGLLDVSLDQGIERVKYVLRTDKGTETDKYEEQQAEATGKTKQFQDERNIRALSLYQSNLSNIAADLVKQVPNIEKQALAVYQQNANPNKSFADNVKAIEALPDNVVTPQVKTMLKVVDRLEQSQAKIKQYFKDGLTEADVKDIADNAAMSYSMLTSASGAGGVVGGKVLKPIIDGILSIPKLASNAAGAKGYGWTDSLSDKTVEATSNLFYKGGDRLLDKQTLIGESNLPKQMQVAKPIVFADRLGSVLGFMATLAGTGGAAAAAGAGKVGQAATLVGTSFATTHDGYFREGVASGLTPTQAGRFAASAAMAQSMLELVSPETRFFSGGVKSLSRAAQPLSKAAIKEYAQALTTGSSMKDAIKKGIKVMVKDQLPEQAQEALQLGADEVVGKFTNYLIDEDKIEAKINTESVVETGLLTTFATAIFGGLSLPGRVRSELENDAYYNLVTDNYGDNLVKLKTALTEAQIPEDQQNKVIGRLNSVQKAYESLQALGKDKQETLTLALAQVERNQLTKSMEGMPKAVQDQIQTKVDQLDTEINEVVQGPNPVPQDYQPPVAEQTQAPTTEPQAAKPTDPAVFGDLQDVKVDAEKQVIVAKAPKTGDEIVLGRETYVKNTDGTKTKARFALIPIGAAQPSNLSTQGFAFNPNYPTDASGKSMNERDYQDVESKQKVERIANELDPEEIISNSVVAETGTPIVDAQMNVVGGNGRTMGLQLLASRTDDASQQRLEGYQDELKGLMGYGFNDEAKSRLYTGKYMLVRVVTEPGYTWGKKESADMNRASTQATTSADVSARITAGLNSDKKVANSFNALVSGAANTNEAITKNGVAMINNLITAGLITPLEAPAYRNEQGVTPEGRTLLENVYLGQVLSAQDVKYLYDNMNEAEGVRNAVLNTLPQVLETRNLGDWSLVSALKEAMEIYRTKQDVYNAATQPSLSGDKKSALSALLAVVFRKGKNQAREILKDYLDFAAVSANSNVALGEKPSPEKTLANLLRPYTKDNTKTDYQLVESIIRSKPATETQAPTAKPEAKAAPAPAATPAPTPPVAPKPTEKTKTEPVKATGEKVDVAKEKANSTFTNPTPETTKQDQAPKTKKSRKKNLPEALNPTVETPIEEVLEPNKTGEQFVEPVVTTPIQEPTKAQKTANKVKALSSAKLKADNKVGEVSIETFDTTDPTTAVKVTIPAEGWGDIVGNQDVNDALYGTGFVQEGNVYVGYVKPGHVDDLIDAMQTQAEVEPVDYEEAADAIADARHKLAQLKKLDQGLRNSDPNKPLGKKTQGLLGLLKLAFPNIQVVTDPTAFTTMQANMGTNSNAFVANGTIYINVNAVDDFTLVEEFGHVWIEIARVTNPTLFKKLLQEARNSPYYQDVLNSPFYQGRGLTQQELEIEAAAKAIADAGEQYLNKSSWRRAASTLYDAVKAWLGETFGFKHPLKGLNFGKVTIKEIANAAAKDLFRAADGELYKARFEWIPKYVQFGTYWSPISQLGTQDLKTLQGGKNVSVETNNNSLLNGERGNYTNQKRALFLRTYFNPTNVILGEKLQNIFVKNIAARNKSKRLVTEIMKRNLDAVNAETDARMALAANKNVARQDIYNQVDKDFHDMLTNTGNVTLYSPEAQAWIPQGRAMLDNAQRELIELEKQYGKALTTTPELMDVLFQQYLAKRELTQAETLISEERDERIDKLREPSANLKQLLDLYSNSARASLNQLKRLQAKLMNGQVALLNQRTQSIEDVLQKQFNKVLEAYEIAIRKQSGPPATITAQIKADSNLANQELEQAKADLETAKKAFEGRVPTSQEIVLADSIEQTIALIEAISAQTGPTTETQIMDAIMRDASQKRMIANLKAQLVAPIAAKYQNVFGTNKFNVQLIFGDGTTHDVGELDEITIKKLQGLGQAAWQDMIGTGRGMYTIPRPDLIMNNYMLERYNESIGQYITRSYQKFDRRTDWARQAKAKIGAQAFGQALNYINKQLARANPKSIVYNKAIEKYIVINSAGIEAQVDNIDAFIDNMRKIGAAPADIIGITNLKNGLSTAFTFSYVTQNRMLANSSKLGLTFVPTVPQVDDVLADIISQDAIASSPTSQGGFNEGIFKMRKDVPEPIRILMGEVTSSNITLPSTYEYVLNAINRIKTEQALFETDVVSTDRTPFHTYQVRFYSPPNTKGDVLVSDEKVGHRRDVWVTPEVAEMMFNELQLGQDVAFIRALTRISSFFKRNFTIFSVGSQARNFISSMYFRKLIGGRWKMGTGYSTVAADASKIADNLIADVKGWENSVKIVGLLQQSFQTVGSKFSKLTDQQVTDLFNEVEELGVVSGSLSLNTVKGMHEFLSGDTKLLSGMSPNATQAQKDSFSQWVEEKIIGLKIKIARGTDALERVYQLGDDLNKIAAYLYEKEYEKSIQSETGLTDQEVKERAASTVRATLPNYDEAAKIFMLISRMPVLASFPMYAAETVRCVYNSAKIGLREIREGKKLGSKKMVSQGSMRVAGATFFGVFGPSAVKMGMSALFELAHSLGFLLDFDMLDDEKEDAMRRLMPDFIKNNTFLGWKNNKTKEITYSDMSYAMPSASFEMSMNAYEREDGGLIDALAEFTKPFLSTDISFNLFLELFLNEDAYGNKIHKPYSQISGYTGDNEAIIATDRAIKGFADYLSYTSERGGAPKIGKEFSNIVKAAAGQVRENGDPYNLSNELSSVFLGMKTNAMLPARRATSIVRNQYDQYQEMVSLVSNAIYNQRNTAEDIDKQRNVQERNMELVFKDIVEIIKAARKLGVTDKEIFGNRSKDGYAAVGILSEAGIGSNLKTELRKAANNPDYVYDPEFSKELEKKLKEAKKIR